jgi:hypothetical protein
MTNCEDNYCRIWSHKVSKAGEQYFKNLRFYLAGIIDCQADNLVRSNLSVGTAPFIAHWLDNKCITFLQKSTKAVKTFSRQASRSSSHISLNSTSAQSLQDVSQKDSEDASEDGSNVEESKLPVNRSFSALPSNVGPRRTSLIPLSDFFRPSAAPASTTVDASDWLLVPSPLRSKFVKLGRYALPKHLFDLLVATWRDSSDMIFAIHPITGSLLLWTVDGLDFPSHSARVVHISFTSCIPHAVSPLIAQNLWSCIPTITFDGLYQLPDVDMGMGEVSIPVPTADNNPQDECTAARNTWFLGLITCHSHGSLNMWSIEQSTLSSNSSISGLIHMCSADGHHGSIGRISPHPHLPIVATHSSHSLQGNIPASLTSQELAIWQYDSANVSKSEELLQMLAYFSITGLSFNHFLWFPIVITSGCQSTRVPQATFLAVQKDTDLVIMELTVYDQMSSTLGSSSVCEGITCTSQFGEHGVKVLTTIKEVFDLEKRVTFLHIFQGSSIESVVPATNNACHFYLVLLESASDSLQKPSTRLKMWRIECTGYRCPEDLFVRASQTPSTLPVSGSWMQTSFMHGNRLKDQLEHKIVGHLVTSMHLPLPSECTVIRATAACDTLNANSTSFSCDSDRLPPLLFSTLLSNGVYVGWQCITRLVAQGSKRDPVESQKEITSNFLSGINYVWTPFLSKVHSDVSNALIIDCTRDLPLYSGSCLAMAITNGTCVAMAYQAAQEGAEDYTTGSAQVFVSIFECESTGGLRWNQEGYFCLNSKQTLLSCNPKVLMEWIPLYNGTFILATCVDSMLYVHGPAVSYPTFSEQKSEQKWITFTQIPLHIPSILDIPSVICSPGCGVLLYSVHNEIRIVNLLSEPVDKEHKKSLLQVIRSSSMSCPQYHPYFITELLNAGRISTAKAVLQHLLVSLKSHDFDATENQTEDIGDYGSSVTGASPRSWIDSLSSSSTSQFIIPPLSLSALGLLSHNDTITTQGNAKEVEDQDLFAEIEMGDYDIQLDLSNSNADDTTALSMDWSIGHSDQLQKMLQCVKLPFLTVFEQVQLISLSQTLATTKMTITKGNVQSLCPSRIEDPSLQFREGMDECSFRYIVALTNCAFIHSILSDNSIVPTVSLTSRDFIWAFHSDAEQDLVSSLPCLQGNRFTWECLRDTGIGWWLRNHETLTAVIEKLAKSLFSVRQEPLDVALFYLAMKKRTLMKTLFKTVKNSRMEEFFSHDFAQERWHKAALKNAFALLTKQRFQEAAAFFLLGDSLQDAVEVCLHKLKDIQLAIIIARLYEGREGGHVYNRILCEEVCAVSSSTRQISQPLNDCFLRSMAYWLLGEYSHSLETLLNCRSDAGTFESTDVNPGVFHIYFYLRNHPILLKRKYELSKGEKYQYLSSVGDDCLTALERLLVFKTATYYINRGLPLLALDVLIKIPPQEYPDEQHVYGSSPVSQGHTMDFSQVPSQLSRNGDAIASGLLFVDPTLDSYLEEKEIMVQSQVNELDSHTSVHLGADGASQISNTEDDDFDWSKPVLLQADHMDSVSDSLELSLGLKRASLSNSSSAYSCLAGDIATAIKSTTNLSYGIHALAKQARCKLALILLCSELNALRAFDDAFTVKKSLNSCISNELVKLCAFCSGGDSEDNCIVDPEHVFDSLIRYCTLHSVDTPNLLYVCTELMVKLRPTLSPSSDTENELSSPIKSRGVYRECICQPSQIPLLSATLIPLTHPYSLAKQLKMLSCHLVHTLSLVPNPPTESFICCASEKLQQLSQCLHDTAILMSNILFCNLTSSEDSPLQDIESSTQSSTSVGLEVPVDSPPTSGKRSKKKVSFNFGSGPGSASLKPNSYPSKWPGLLNWPNLLPSVDGKDPQGLCLLLVECIVPTYLALLAHSWLNHSASITLRLLKNPLSLQLWCDVCGGGYESTSSSRSHTAKKSSKFMGKFPGSKKSKQLKSDGPEIAVDRCSSGFFVPPKAALFKYLLLDNIGNDDPDLACKDGDGAVDQTLDFAWLLMNLGAVRHVQSTVHTFIALTGIDVMELSSQSASLNKCCKVLELWQDGFVAALERCKEHNPFLGKDNVNSSKGPSLLKHKSLLDPKNSPFNTDELQFPNSQNLWDFLLHDEIIREGTFIKYIFRGKEVSDHDYLIGGPPQHVDCLLYKSKESESGISSMCVSEGSLNHIAIAMAKEIIELDTAEAWKSETYTEDIENSMINETPTLHTKLSDEFVLVHSSPRNAPLDLPSGVSAQQQSVIPSNTSEATQVLSRPCPGVKRLCSHPILPYYLAGDSEGCVAMYEFGNVVPLFPPTKTSTGGSVSRIRYTPHGNKFAVSDVQGNIFMWKGTQGTPKPYTYLHCHSRGTNDFAYMASSSLIAAAGESSENRNVCIFDTLLPAGRSSVVKGMVLFLCLGEGGDILDLVHTVRVDIFRLVYFPFFISHS